MIISLYPFLQTLKTTAFFANSARCDSRPVNKDPFTIELMNYKKASICNCKGDVSKQWFVYYWYPEPGSETLKRFRVYQDINDGKNKKDKTQRAVRLRDSVNRMLSEGWSPFEAKKPMTVAEAFEVVLREKVQSIRPVTRITYESVARIFLDYATKKKLIDKPVKEITRYHIQAFLVHLTNERKINNNTRNNYRGHVGVFFNYLVTIGELKESPVERVPLLAVTTKNQNIPFTTEEADRLIRYMERHDPMMLRFVKFIYYCGMRPKEILSVRISAIDFRRRRIHLSGDQAKDKEAVYISIPPHFAQELECLQQLNPEWYLFRWYKKDGQFVFEPAPGNNPTYRSRISERFTVIRKKCKVPDGRNLYSWKHFGAVQAYEAGVDVIDIMNQFRHSSLDMTYKYLASLGLRDTKQFGEKIPKL